MSKSSPVLLAIYADSATRQWVVRDSDRTLWSLPPTQRPWEDRQRFTPAEGTDLVPVPGHYRYLLGLSA